MADAKQDGPIVFEPPTGPTVTLRLQYLRHADGSSADFVVNDVSLEALAKNGFVPASQLAEANANTHAERAQKDALRLALEALTEHYRAQREKLEAAERELVSKRRQVAEYASELARTSHEPEGGPIGEQVWDMPGVIIKRDGEPAKQWQSEEPEATVVAEPSTVWLIESQYGGEPEWAVVYHGTDGTKVTRWTTHAADATQYGKKDHALDVLPLIVDDWPGRELTVTEHIFDDQGLSPFDHALPPTTNDWRNQPLTVGMAVDALRLGRDRRPNGGHALWCLAESADELERIAKGGAR